MPDPKQEESFKVIDRRLFSADGEIRDEAARDERRKQESEPSASVSTPSNSAAKPAASPISAPGQTSTARSENETAEVVKAQEVSNADGPKPSRGLEMLINFVAQNAAMLLGAYPDPRTGEAMLDLEGARELVDMLDALREATRGNLAADDERLLIDVLGSLKLSFMEMTKAAAKMAQDKVKARP